VLKRIFENGVWKRIFENGVLKRIFENGVWKRIFENGVLKRIFENGVWKRIFENGVLKRIFGPNRDDVTVNGESYIMRSLMICTAQYFSGDSVEMGGVCSAYGEEERRIQGFGGDT